MQKSILPIAIMIAVSVSCGWMGIALNRWIGYQGPPLESLGALIWLVSPALAGFALRAIAKEGWRDAGFSFRFSENGRWYLLALTVYPLAAVLPALLGYGSGAISFGGFSSKGWSAYAMAASTILAGSFVKNLFEEFAWRSYLTPRLEAAGTSPWKNHVIVGLVWWAWHLPYYYYFLDRAILTSAITTSIPVFLAIGLVVQIPTAVLFGELRLASQSTWPVFLLHQMINALSMPLLINGFIAGEGPLAPIFTPTNEGLLVSAAFGYVGWRIMRHRLNTV